jgi:hypothetical protein
VLAVGNREQATVHTNRDRCIEHLHEYGRVSAAGHSGAGPGSTRDLDVAVRPANLAPDDTAPVVVSFWASNAVFDFKFSGWNASAKVAGVVVATTCEPLWAPKRPRWTLHRPTATRSSDTMTVNQSVRARAEATERKGAQSCAIWACLLSGGGFDKIWCGCASASCWSGTEWLSDSIALVDSMG